MECERCGNQPVAGDRFCRQCGSPLGEPESVSLPRPPLAVSPESPGTSGWAVASLVLGVASIMLLPLIGSLLAIAFGIVAKSEIKREHGKLTDSRMASAGIIMGSLGLALLVIAVIVFTVLAFNYMEVTHSWEVSVELEGASTVEARLEMRDGELLVKGGAMNMLDAKFIYSMLKNKPALDYAVNEGRGRLVVRQSPGGRSRPVGARNQWDLALRDGVPLDLFISLGRADGHLYLNTLGLMSLALDTLSGDAFVDLSGVMPRLKRVEVNSEGGDLTLLFNGSYELPLDVDISGGGGDVEVEFLGTFAGGLEGNLEMGSGDLHLHLPKGVGVYVAASSVSGEIRSSGLKRQEVGVWVNEAYGVLPLTLRLNVKSGSGDIWLMIE